MSGKGSAPRPLSVSNEDYAKRWDAIFHRDPKVVDDSKAEDEAFDSIMKRNEYYDILTTEDAIASVSFDNIQTK